MLRRQDRPLSLLNCVSWVRLGIRGHVLCERATDYRIRILRDSVALPFAVLDLRFTGHRKGVFAIATSIGSVRMYTINLHGTGPIEALDSYQIFPESSITLSLAWNCQLCQSDTIAASSSDGHVAIFDTKYQPPNATTKIEAHSLAAWTVAWTYKAEEDLDPVLDSGGDSPADSNPVPHSPAGNPIDLLSELHSGGDDSVLCRYGVGIRQDSGSPLSEGDEFEAPSRDSKTHMAGVTAILPLQTVFDEEQVLLTGSYDEFVRVLLPTKGSNRSKILAEERLGGGVWRLKVLDVVELDSGKGMQPSGGPIMRFETPSPYPVSVPCPRSFP